MGILKNAAFAVGLGAMAAGTIAEAAPEKNPFEDPYSAARLYGAFENAGPDHITQVQITPQMRVCLSNSGIYSRPDSSMEFVKVTPGFNHYAPGLYGNILSPKGAVYSLNLKQTQKAYTCVGKPQVPPAPDYSYDN